MELVICQLTSKSSHFLAGDNLGGVMFEYTFEN
jgi:hypothetical protein